MKQGMGADRGTGVANPKAETQQTPDQQMGHDHEHWRWVQSQLKREYGQAQFDRWLRPLQLSTISGGVARLSVPTDFMRDWVERNYLNRIRSLMATGPDPIADVCVDVVLDDGEELSASSRQNELHKIGASLNGVQYNQAGISPATHANARLGSAIKSYASGQRAAAAPTQDPGLQAHNQSMADGVEGLGGRLEPRYSFETFVVGKSNAFAHAAARRVSESQSVPFNPLFLHGGVGLGKTHLMNAIAWEYSRLYPERRVMYISAEKFMYQFIASVRYRDTMSFKQQFRSVDLLMLDDFQFIANKDSTQEEFFHTFNALIESQKQLIISADRSPTDLEGFQERIVSRLGWGLVADIHPTDYELRLGILQSKAEALSDLEIPMDILDFLARKITSNVRELEGALNRVVAYGQLVGRAITIDVVREVLADLLRANDRKINIDDIQKAVADHYNLRVSEMLSERRSRNIARPRQVAMYLAKKLTQRSLPEIGRKFSGRDHTTVIHAVKKIDDLRHSDATLDDDLTRLTRRLQG
ncbi:MULTISPECIES: chromosomal replication initiator protein DnaA [unclassified Iodidimonas]|jgi:chromosomal replication initiator protein|uniref:chromosomal replication initiator protein DnaA n=1 Tax=unclassified Iodidimonas TaxID=2626145 RepID=UPI002483101D|nr:MULTISPECIES: chromosomal replication initiator protein DnaA [unclassified Iodidimonas]